MQRERVDRNPYRSHAGEEPDKRPAAAEAGHSVRQSFTGDIRYQCELWNVVNNSFLLGSATPRRC